MSWSAIDQCEEWIDWSWYNNQGPDYDYVPYDVDEFIDKNPNIRGAILRINWPSGKPDAHFQYYYDAFTRRGVKVLIYFWTSPLISLNKNFEYCKQSLDGRKVYGAIKDIELHWNMDRTTLTTYEQSALGGADKFFGVQVDVYSRAYFINDYMVCGSWLTERNIIVANYKLFFRIPGTNKWRQAENHTEMNGLLPIDNNFTPYLGSCIPEKKVAGWQFSEKLKLPGTTSGSDGDYLKKWYVNSKFDIEDDEEDEQPIPTIQVPRHYDKFIIERV